MANILAIVVRLNFKKEFSSFSVSLIYNFFQGGPHSHHIHMSNLPDDAATCDRFVCAEIPDLPDVVDKSALAVEQRRYHSLVVKYMIHFCSNQSDCWNGRRCVKGFPKQFIRNTIVYPDKPAEYRRRAPIDGGNTYTVPKTGITYDNRHVIPHNRYLLLRWGGFVHFLKFFSSHYSSHINIEWVCVYFFFSTCFA